MRKSIICKECGSRCQFQVEHRTNVNSEWEAFQMCHAPEAWDMCYVMLWEAAVVAPCLFVSLAIRVVQTRVSWVSSTRYIVLVLKFGFIYFSNAFLSVRWSVADLKAHDTKLPRGRNSQKALQIFSAQKGDCHDLLLISTNQQWPENIKKSVQSEPQNLIVSIRNNIRELLNSTISLRNILKPIQKTVIFITRWKVREVLT